MTVPVQRYIYTQLRLNDTCNCLLAHFAVLLQTIEISKFIPTPLSGVISAYPEKVSNYIPTKKRPPCAFKKKLTQQRQVPTHLSRYGFWW
jgi:hypothetical protein